MKYYFNIKQSKFIIELLEEYQDRYKGESADENCNLAKTLSDYMKCVLKGEYKI